MRSIQEPTNQKVEVENYWERKSEGDKGQRQNDISLSIAAGYGNPEWCTITVSAEMFNQHAKQMAAQWLQSECHCRISSMGQKIQESADQTEV